MAKPIHMSRRGTVTNSKEVATTKMPAIHTLSKQAILTLHSPLRHNKPTEDDSNREATKIGTVRLRQRMQVVQVRPVAATVRQMLGSL